MFTQVSGMAYFQLIKIINKEFKKSKKIKSGFSLSKRIKMSYVFLLF